MTVSVDSTRLRARPDNVYVVCTKWKFARPQLLRQVSGKSRAYRSLTSQLLVKCDPILHKTGTTIYYDASGDPVESDYFTGAELAVTDWSECIPDMIGERAYIAICDKVPRLLLPAKR